MTSSSSTVTPSPNPTPAPAAAAPTSASSGTLPALVAEPVLHFLLMELLPTLDRSTPHAAAGDREAVYFKLEMLGYNVGQRLVERLAKDHARFKDTLDVVKFICKEFWTCVFGKQVDNLKTNHRGVYVLQDNQFAWFRGASGSGSAAETTQAMAPYLWFPCGLIRGALAGLGLATVVMAESAGLPQCTFQIKIASRGH